MSIRVFHRDSNPAIDPHSYRCSNSSGKAAVERGEGEYITLPTGRTVIKLFRPQAARETIFPYIVAESSASLATGGRLSWRPPKHESWLHTLRTSTIPNVRDFAAVL
jgi:hypothetical protein